MRWTTWAFVLAISAIATSELAAQRLRQPNSLQRVSYRYNYLAQAEESPSDLPATPNGEAAAVDADVVPAEASDEAKGGGDDAWDKGDSGCCDNGCCDGGCCGNGCCDGGCDSACGCCGRDAWTLFPNDECSCVKVGGWLQAGYHNRSTGLFNDYPDHFALHQAWVYAEKVAKAGACSWDWGFRADFMYGLDAQKTQAFGNPNADIPDSGTWDASWDNGVYGYAFPQLYGEIARGDFSLKFGHFFTLVGYEVVPATGNFFYSHAMTMFNSEPFTHTGALATYKASDDLEVYAGWTLGWDTGFDQLGDGSNFLGGFSASLTDSMTATYITTMGDMGDAIFPNGRGDGYTHSIVLDVNVTDNFNYVLQSDMVNLNTFGGNNDEIGVNQYFIYTLNDCWSYGSRVEWWKSDAGFDHGGQSNPTGQSISYYGWTTGLNYIPHPNLRIRPEIRHDWSPAADYDKYVFGVDMVMTF